MVVKQYIKTRDKQYDTESRTYGVVTVSLEII